MSVCWSEKFCNAIIRHSQMCNPKCSSTTEKSQQRRKEEDLKRNRKNGKRCFIKITSPILMLITLHWTVYLLGVSPTSREAPSYSCSLFFIQLLAQGLAQSAPQQIFVECMNWIQDVFLWLPDSCVAIVFVVVAKLRCISGLKISTWKKPDYQGCNSESDVPGF